jgi:hypothetical protein
MADFSFEEPSGGSGGQGSRYGNNPMDNLLAGEMTQQFPPQQSKPQSSSGTRGGQERQGQRQQQNLADVTQENTLSNSKNLGYDPSEYMVMDDNQLSSVNDVNLFVRIMLGLILFFQIFIIFRLFAQQNR